MGRKMLNKLHSRKGASITFALLAFLVCAVISAVLLASASAAAGRASGLAEMDQRYYAVTSAVQLFCDAISEGKSYTLECTEVKVAETYMRFGPSPVTGDIVLQYGSDTPVDQPSLYEYRFRMASADAIADDAAFYNDGDTNPLLDSPNLLEEAALYCVFGEGVTESDHVVGLVKSSFEHEKVTPNKVTKVFQIKESEEKAAYLGLTVDVKIEIAPDGSMLLTFSNHLTNEQIENNEGVYYMQVGLSANAITKVSYSEKEINKPTYPKFDPVYLTYEESTQTFKTTVKTTTVTWSVGSVSKVYKSSETSGSGGT